MGGAIQHGELGRKQAELAHGLRHVGDGVDHGGGGAVFHGLMQARIERIGHAPSAGFQQGFELLHVI